MKLKLKRVLAEGDPGSFVRLLDNGPSGATTVALLPQNLSLSGGRPFGPVVPSILAVTPPSDPAVQFTCVGTPGKNYLLQARTNLSIIGSGLTISLSY